MCSSDCFLIGERFGRFVLLFASAFVFPPEVFSWIPFRFPSFPSFLMSLFLSWLDVSEIPFLWRADFPGREKKAPSLPGSRSEPLPPRPWTFSPSQEKALSIQSFFFFPPLDQFTPMKGIFSCRFFLAAGSIGPHRPSREPPSGPPSAPPAAFYSWSIPLGPFSMSNPPPFP